MKKILLSVIAVGLMSVSAMAHEGTISKITVKSDGTASMILLRTDTVLVNKRIDGSTPDANKAMIAVILTAKSQGATVDANTNGAIWTGITLK